MNDKLKNIRHLALDLDGTLYLGGRAFEWTIPFLATIEKLGIGHTFFTNNSSRSTREYVHHLEKFGIKAGEDDIFSSTHATIEYLRNDRPNVKRIFVLGTPALQEEFSEKGFTLCGVDPSDEPDAVIIGFDTSLAYPRVCHAAYWISKNKPFIATHCDRICPTDKPTVLPDCGAMCAMLTAATGREPDAVLGKPDPRMISGILRKHGLKPHEIAVVGDRLYTDMAMARNAGAVGILVLSGETTRADASRAAPPPDLIVENVGELSKLLVAR